MKPKLLRNLVLISFAAALLSMAACKSQNRTDAQVASDIQVRLNADQAVHNKQIAVLAANGVVTLSGSVNSDAERSAVASDAASVNGVRTVVNNLTVQPADASAAQDEPQSPAVGQQPSSTASQAPAPQPATKPNAARQNGKSLASAQDNAPLTQAEAMRQQQNSSEPVQNQPAPPPPAPAPPENITIPDGTVVAVRMLDTLDSETAKPGDAFRATLNSPVQVDGRVVIPADADVFGRVVDVHAAGRFKGSALLTIEITKVSFNGRAYPIHTDQWSKQTDGRGKGTAEKVGGGAALGALIGALAGGGKGAGIGAAVGAGAGGVTQAAVKAAQIKLGPESLLTFHLAQPVTVQPSNYIDRNAGRQRVD
jgi:hypothetical protein